MKAIRIGTRTTRLSIAACAAVIAGSVFGAGPRGRTSERQGRQAALLTGSTTSAIGSRISWMGT